MPLYHTTFTDHFCDSWRALLRELYRYEEHEDFLVVRDIMGRPTFSYLPLLNYTNLTREKALRLAQKAHGSRYLIRSLNPGYREFKEGDTVTMRIDLGKPSFDDVFQGIAKRTRRYIRDTEAAISIKSGHEPHLTDQFYAVFTDVMHRLGTPVFSKHLFSLLPRHMNARYYVASGFGQPIAAGVVIYDDNVAWIPWSGTRTPFLEKRPGLPMYLQAIQDAYDAGKPIFDFGRSGYGMGTFEFKERWGAKPVKIDLLSETPQLIYDKYQTASRIWKSLPRHLVNFAGPQLCKFLVDL